MAPRPVPAAERRARVAAMFDELADVYDDVGVEWFTPIARVLVEQVSPPAGARALDIGCGRGAALFALAELVGTGGRVTGIDLSRRMVEATRDDVRARRLRHVDVQVMDASAPRLPRAGYDVAVASFVLFFLPAPIAALRAWRELLVPGGRLGLSTLAESAGWLEEVFRPYLGPSVFGDSEAATPFSTDAGVEELLDKAGFVSIRTLGFDFDVAFADAAQWHAWSRSHGQRAVWDSIRPADRDRIRTAAAERLERSRGPDGLIRLPHRIRLTLAERPR